jgi:heme/copper-type cytochrome/quinol oxidase subunit 2
LSDGMAMLEISGLSVGSHYITVVYDGDVNFINGSSLAHIHRVKASGINWWLIIGIIGAAVAAKLFFWLLFFRRRRKRKEPAQAQSTP